MSIVVISCVQCSHSAVPRSNFDPWWSDGHSDILIFWVILYGDSRTRLGLAETVGMGETRP